MDSIERSRLDRKIEGWKWVQREFDRLRGCIHAETERLLGPDRGE